MAKEKEFWKDEEWLLKAFCGEEGKGEERQSRFVSPFFI
jgi:hypothetical protein